MSLYQDFQAEFGIMVRLSVWAELPGYAQDAIIRDAMHRFTEFQAVWDNLTEFVANYVEVVESAEFGTTEGFTPTSIQMWTQWGTTLRLLEVTR